MGKAKSPERVKVESMYERNPQLSVDEILRAIPKLKPEKARSLLAAARGAAAGGGGRRGTSRGEARKHLKLLVERYGAEKVKEKIQQLGQSPIYQMLEGLGGKTKTLAALDALSQKRQPDTDRTTQKLFAEFENA